MEEKIKSIVEVLKDVSFKDWKLIEETINLIYEMSNEKNTLNCNKDISKIINDAITYELR